MRDAELSGRIRARQSKDRPDSLVIWARGEALGGSRAELADFPPFVLIRCLRCLPVSRFAS
jgi:hypothetical protein